MQREREFIAAADVGIFFTVGEPPLVPDMFLVLDVHLRQAVWEKRNRSYLMCEYGKPPDVVIEIVSHTKGDELGRRLRAYERMRVSYYVVFDPIKQLGTSVLQLYDLQGMSFVPSCEVWLPGVELGLKLWYGTFEDLTTEWLRWCYEDSSLVSTGVEQAKQAEARSERLAAQLRALGIEPAEV